MNPFSIRVLASLVRATPKQVEVILQEREAEAPFGFLTYSGAYRILRRNASRPDRALQALERWRDDETVKPRTSAFRCNSFPSLQWCAAKVLPRIRRVIRELDGDRQKSGRLLELAGVRFTGGFHLLVEWSDDSERLVYFLGPEWTRKRIRHLMVLLQAKAVQVYGRTPQSVVLVDIRRREIHELRALDATDWEEAERTAAWLRDYMQDRPAA